jgi:hypothetical protein
MNTQWVVPVLCASLLSGCGDDLPQGGLTASGPPTNALRTCIVDKADNGAFRFGVVDGYLAEVTIQNQRCPYAVRSVGAPVTLNAKLKRKYGPGEGAGAMDVMIYNANKLFIGSAFANSVFSFPSCLPNSCIEWAPTTSYPGGTGLASDNKPRDSVAFAFLVPPSVPGSIFGTAKGYATLPATVNPSAHVVSPSGPTPLARTVTFVNSTAVDTGHFVYAWEVDGASVAGVSGARLTRTFSNPGAHTVVSRARYADNTEVVSSTVVNAQLIVGIDGPLSLSTGSTGSWAVAGDPGGTGPYTYEWRVNGSVEGMDSHFQWAAPSPGYHTISLQVTDASGVTNASAIGVHVSEANCGYGCNQTRTVRPRAGKVGAAAP